MGISNGKAQELEPGVSRADVLLRHPTVVWEGWGTSLAWWGKVIGATPNAEAWADLFFSMKDLPMCRIWSDRDEQETIPCLGLNIARYNIGGVGHVPTEKTSYKSRGWHAEIEGFQREQGTSFDWSRDPQQRRCLRLAVERGVDRVELFSNAPMWWMMDSKSSFGGSLACADDFINYLVEVAAYMRSEEGCPVVSLSPFNEPSAGWWKYPHNQEGCNVPVAQQEGILVKLRGVLHSRGLDDVRVAASDENTVQQGLDTWRQLRNGPAKGCVGQLNVHGYDGLDPWSEDRRPGIRGQLRDVAKGDGLPLWMSEYGGKQKSGMDLAKSILEDMHHLRPTAWIYWQILEHRCPWGLVECDFGHEGAQNPATPHPKYFVFAHFTRYFRPGVEVLQCTEPWATAAYSPDAKTLTCVMMNSGPKARTMILRIPTFTTLDLQAEAVTSEPDANKLFVPSKAEVNPLTSCDGFEMIVDLPAVSVCSLVVHSVSRGAKNAVSRAGGLAGSVREAFVNPAGVTAEQAVELARCAAQETVTERQRGEWHPETQAKKSRFEHQCAGLDADLRAAAPSEAARCGRELQQLVDLVRSAAWGVANERAYGAKNADAIKDFAQFHNLRKQHCFADDVNWAIWNTCWSVANQAYFGEGSSSSQESAEAAESHLLCIGRSSVILPRKAFRTADQVSTFPRWVAFIRHAEAGHNVNPALHARVDNPLTAHGENQAVEAGRDRAGAALKAADVVVTTPLMRALQTTRLLQVGAQCLGMRTRVDAAGTELRRQPCDDGTPKAELLKHLPEGADTWEGWEKLEERWWPDLEDDEDIDRRVTAFREMVRSLPEDRVVFIGHGAFWQKLFGIYLENCDVVYCDRLL